MAPSILGDLDDLADSFLRLGKHHVRPLARVLLLSTFIEDGFRMFTQWEDQTAYIKGAWGCGSFLAILFVLFNLVGQLIPAALILIRAKDVHIRIGVFLLASVLVVQTLAYSVLWNAQFFMRNTAVAGSLLLVYAETAMENKNMFAGLPSAGGETKLADILQAGGRVMLVVMFLTMLRFDSAFRIIVEIIEFVMMLGVALGIKSKLCALILVILLFIENVFFNGFWMEHSHSATYDFKKYDFFQTLSVIGGLLMVVACGPGGIAMDERKKAF